jgi:CRP/FNR family transcriptional regulator, cyclic AMP receptor protein
MSSETFQELSFFQGLTPAQLDILLSLFVETNCHAGTVLFDQDEPAVFLYLVISGEVSIRYKPDDGEAITIARVRPGGIVGWSSAIGRRMYTSAAVCTQYTELLRASGAEIQALCEQHPETGIILLDRLAAVIEERLNSTHPEVRAILENGLRNNCE